MTPSTLQPPAPSAAPSTAGTSLSGRSSNAPWWSSAHASATASTAASSFSAAPGGSIDKIKQHETSTWKPESKTALGRATWNSIGLPHLYVVEVEVKSDNRRIGSRKLRYKALKDLVKKLDLPPNTDVIFNLDARKHQLAGAQGSKWEQTAARNGNGPLDDADKLKNKDPTSTIKTDAPGSEDKQSKTTAAPSSYSDDDTLIDHLILPHAQDQSGNLEVLQKFVDKFNQSIEVESKKIARKIDKDRGIDDDKSIICMIREPGKILEPTDQDDLYATCIKLVFRKHAGEKDSISRYDVNSEYLDDTRSNILNSHHLAVFYRQRMTFEKDEEASHGYKFHVDIDLVPGVTRQQRVIAFLEGYFSGHMRSSPTGVESRFVQKIKHVLCGLHVNYQHAYGNNKEVRVIKDIKSSCDIPMITLKDNDANTELQLISVRDYVDRFVTPLDPNYRNLPLADIGGKRSYWVPLELLIFSHHQSIGRAGHFTQLIQHYRATLDKVDTKVTINRLARLTLAAVQKNSNQINSTKKLPDVVVRAIPVRKANNKFVRNEPKLKIPNAKREEKADGSNPIRAKIAIIYVAPEDGLTNSLDIYDDVLNGFASQNKVSFTPTKPPIAVVQSFQDILRQQQNPVSHLMSTIESSGSPDVLLGVIDGRDRNTKEYSEIKSELKRLADRQVGAVIACVNKQNLEAALAHSATDRSNPMTNTFPPNILRKIRYMLGGSNWITEFPVSNTMIVGAHISHPDSSSKESYPSVAAVVASVTPNPMQYYGSTRLQTTYKNVSEQDPVTGEIRTMKLVQTRIDDLESMMEERFESWRKENPDEKSPDVLFYRDAYLIGDGETCLHEQKAIENAYRKVFGYTEAERIRYTYIILSKNSRRYKVPYSTSNHPKNPPPFTFTTVQYEEIPPEADSKVVHDRQDASKYQYHVAYNELDYSPDKLAELTSKLNLTSQLCAYTSVALPIVYATKLSRRILNYYKDSSFDVVYKHPVTCMNRLLEPGDENIDAERMRRSIGEDLQVQSVSRNEDFSKDASFLTEKVLRSKEGARPWKEQLDEKMFYL